MPKIGTITLKKAKSIISNLPNYFIPVGSIAREKKRIGDIDLISLKPIKIAKKYLEDNLKILEVTSNPGKKNREFFFISKIGNQKIHFNIWYHTKLEFPYAYFVLSYPKSFVIRVKGTFKRNGYKLNQYGLYKGNKKINKINGIIIKNNKSFFDILYNAFGYNYNYISPKKQELKGSSLDFIPKKLYQTIANAYRKLFCNGKSRSLEEGEFHPLCANYIGPGTRIDLYPDYPPFNNIDNCARTHDYDYNEIFKIKDNNERQQKIRDADNKFLKCIEQFKNEEPYYTIGKKGISGKIKVEDLLPNISSKLVGNYFGKNFSLN